MLEHTLSEQFASDNYSGACPEVLEAIVKANEGYTSAYGNDIYTERAANKIRDFFEKDCEVFFVFNGTSANSLSLATIGQSYHSVVCHELAHIETDECGAPQFFSNGVKLLLAKSDNGKVTPEYVEKLVTKRSDIHYAKPKTISLTQSTEVGTVYTVEELHALSVVAKSYNLKIQMDGARFANAVASLGVKPSDITWKAGVDVLCLGGTKNGMAMGEAVVFFDKKLAEDFGYRCKQAGQLASKMRFISAQWLGLLENDVWLRNAQNANNMAMYFANELKSIDGITFMFETEANAVFVNMPPKLIKDLWQKGWHFYTFIGLGGARFVFSWNSTKERIDALISDIKDLI